MSVQPIYYRCVKCDEYRDVQHCGSYCQYCGAKQPSEARLQALGYAWYPAPNTPISNVECIREFFRKHAGCRAHLWTYGNGFSTACIHLARSEDENTMIKCVGVASISVPTMSWDSDFVLETTDGSNSTRFLLKDRKAGVLVNCHAVYVQDVNPLGQPHD